MRLPKLLQANGSGGPIDPRLLKRGQATRGYLAATVIVGVGQVTAIICQAWLLASVISHLVSGGALDTRIFSWIGFLAMAIAVRAGLSWLQPWLGHRAAAQVKSQLRRDVMAARLAKPYNFSITQQNMASDGRITTLMGAGLDALDGWYARYLPQLVLGILAPLVLVIVIGSADPISAVVIACTLPLIPVFMVLVGLATRRQMDRRWRAQAVLGHHFADLITGLTTLQLFGRARSQLTGLRHAETRHRRETMSTLRVAFLSALVLELAATLSVALVAVGVGLRVVDAELALFPALFVLVLAPEAFLPLRQVGTHYHDAADGVAAAKEALDLIDESAQTQPGLSSQIEVGNRSPSSVREDLPGGVERVRLVEASTDRTASLTADCRAGSVTVLTGPSGGGKTTALQLILGLLRPTSGRVELIGPTGAIELTADLADQWRGQIAWVPQLPGLFPGTVAENITFGRLAGTPEERLRLRELLDRCGGRDIGLDQQVGDDGRGLSIGEGRRVALARALLRVLDHGARWLILDEPTAGLDADTEAEVIAGLPDHLGVIMVSHRPAVLARADQIITITPIQKTVPEKTVPGERPPGKRDPGGKLADEQPGARHEGRLQPLAVVLGVLASGSGVALIGTAAWLLAKAAEHPPVLHLMVAVVGVRFFGIGKGVFRYAERLVGHQVALAKQSRLRLTTYRRLADRLLPSRGRSDLVSRLTRDVAATVDHRIRVVLPSVTAALVSLGAIVFVATVSIPAAAALVGGIVVAAVIAPAVSHQVTRRSQSRLARDQGALADRVSIMHRLAPELAAYDQAADQLNQLAHLDATLRRTEQRAASATGTASALQVAALGLTSVLSLMIAAAGSAQHELSPPMIAVLALLPLAMADVFAGLPGAAVLRSATAAALRRVARIGTTSAVIAAQRPDDHGSAPAPARGGLQLDHVAVGWNADMPLLQGISATCRPGDRLVLAGRSGLGKTTLIATIAGLLSPIRGTVTVPGRVGVLSQDAHIFDTTVRENLRLARPEATDAELRETLDRVQLGHLDLARPVGEHGAAISGGEARRIALARLLLLDLDVVLLDEPTEHLDQDIACRLLTDIDRLWPQAAIIAVSHEPTLAAEALDARVLHLEHAQDAPARPWDQNSPVRPSFTAAASSGLS